MDSDDFFGFDASQMEDDRGRSYDREDDDDFDALNDETFGNAATGDWETQHRQMSGLLDDEDKQPGKSTSGDANASSASQIRSGVAIPGSAVISASAASGWYDSYSLSNGLNNLHMRGVSSFPSASCATASAIGTFGSYNTPPKSSFIDPAKLSESPGSGIWAPEPAMLEKMGMKRLSPEQPGSSIFSLLQQTSSTAKQQQTDFHQQQQLFNLPASTGNYNSSWLSGGLSNQLPQQNTQQQLFNMNLNALGGGFSLQDRNVGVASNMRLPLGLAGNVKSVADLEMEMRLQQLKSNTNAADKPEVLEHQSAHTSNSMKPLQPFFTEQQQLQQIQQNQLMEIQQKRPLHHQHHPQQQQAQHRLAQIHPLTGQPLTTVGTNNQLQHQLRLQQQQQQHHPNYHYMQLQQHQQLLANINKRQQQQPQLSHFGAGVQPAPHLNQNYHNFPNNQRSNSNNYNNQYSNNGGSRGNWIDFDSNGAYYDRRNMYNKGATNVGSRDDNNYDRRNSDYHQHPLHHSYQHHGGVTGGGIPHRGGGSGADYGGAGAAGSRVRRDSEAEWEEWERRREEDEYAGLMTPKQKSWLRNIQTMQLATDNPYRDDYYYVMHEAKVQRPHPHAPLRIHGLSVLLPALGDTETSAAATYQPPAMENSLGKLQVASVNAPRKIMDLQVVHLDASEPTTKLQMQMRTHRLLLLSIEKLYTQLMELEDLDRKAAYLPDSPTRDTFMKRSKELAREMWQSVSGSETRMLDVLSIRKGKTLIAELVGRTGSCAAETLLMLVLTHLPQLTRQCQPQYQNTLNILWPIADQVLANASSEQLIKFASKLMPHLNEQKEADILGDGSSNNGSKDSDVSPVLASKFGISVIVGLLVRGEQVYSEVTKQECWQEFLSRVIAVLAGVQNPKLVSTLVRDSGNGAVITGSKNSSKKSPAAPVVVLSRGQSLSSLTKQRALAGGLSATTASLSGNCTTTGASSGRLTPPLPLVAVTAAAGSDALLQQPRNHLARCTEQVNSGVLAAAQSALERLELVEATSASGVSAGNVARTTSATTSGSDTVTVGIVPVGDQQQQRLDRHQHQDMGRGAGFGGRNVSVL